MSSSAPGGSFGRLFGLHGKGSEGRREVDKEEEEEEEEDEEEAMAVSGVGELFELELEFRD